MTDDYVHFLGKEIETIVSLISSNRLKEAIVQIQAMAASTNDWKLKSEIETISTSYELMLDYDKKGYKDPNLSEQYAKIIARTYELMDWARNAKGSKQSATLYNRIQTKYKDNPGHTFEEIREGLESYTEDMATVSILYPDMDKQKKEISAIKERHEKYLNELFEQIWISTPWNKETESAIMEILHSVVVPVNDICVLVSAVTMAATRWFDIRKYLFLAHAYQHENIMINQRAIVGLALMSLFYHERIILYPQAQFILKEFKDNPNFIHNLYNIQMQILLTRETEKIDEKMRNEIIPNVMKNFNDTKLFTDEMLSEDNPKRNPSWESWTNDARIEKSFKELDDLQKSGADMYMGPFSMLKRYPFFTKISHWFYPFDIHYTGLDELEEKIGNNDSIIIKLILDSDMFCNSDKYSMCFNLLMTPLELQKEMLAQFNEQSEALSEQQQEMINEKLIHNTSAQQISRQYIHDLYRFYKLWIYKAEEYDVFDDDFALWENSDLGEILNDETILKSIADFLLDKEYFVDANLLFLQLSKMNNTNVEYYQKGGYALERLSRYEMAVDRYQEAETLEPNDPWILHRMAVCYMKSLHMQKALDYFKRVEAQNPDNLRITLETGRCLLELGRYEEALSYFFKVEYLSKKPLDARRAIGWCYFNLGKTEEAKKYYDMVLEEKKPSKQDWMNAAHIQLVLDNTQQAIIYYKNAVESSKDFEDFLNDYWEDMQILIAQGVNPEKLKFLPDELL